MTSQESHQWDQQWAIVHEEYFFPGNNQVHYHSIKGHKKYSH